MNNGRKLRDFMNVMGKDVQLRLLTGAGAVVVPFCECDVREQAVLLEEYAGIEGGAVAGAVSKAVGAGGAFVTPLTKDIAAPLLAFAFGAADEGTAEEYNLFRYGLSLANKNESYGFDFEKVCGEERTIYRGAVCSGFSFDVMRARAVKCKFGVEGGTMYNERCTMNNFAGYGNIERFLGRDV
jgi:hypothetical protein